jgi:hypothetical protein
MGSIAIGNTGNCTTEVKGTGVRACDIYDFGDVRGKVLFEKGYYATITNGNAEFDLAAYTDLVKGLKAFPLTPIETFSQNTPENEKSTGSTGVMNEIRSGKPQFSFTYAKGGCFHKALYDKAGNGRWDVGLLFGKGILMAKNIDGTKLKGFNAGMLSVETFKLLQGGDLQQGTSMLQFLDAEEFNARFEWIPFSVAGDLGSVQGVIETEIKVNPIVAGTEFSAKITSSCNSGDPILDLEGAPLKFVLLGVQASVTTISTVVYNATNAEYDFTVSPALIATDTVQIQLNDGTFKVVSDTMDNLFKGTSNTVIV